VTAAGAHATQLGPKRTPVAHEPALHEQDILRVKFRDGLRLRLRNGVPSDPATDRPALDSRAFPGSWRRAYSLPEQRLETLWRRARANLNRLVTDPNLEFEYLLPAGQDTNATIADFHAHELVEYALPVPKPPPAPAPPPAPIPPDYEPLQGYLDAAPGGIGVDVVRAFPGGTGLAVRIADVEYSWNRTHQDLPAVTLLGNTPVDPYNDDNHGTAVLGELVARDNGWGVTGIAPDAVAFVVAANTASGYDPADAILVAAAGLAAGDVILIEQQINGPAPGSIDYVPLEWWLPAYNAIVTSVGLGVVVVEAAGNGGQDLDDPIFSQGNGGHYPFLPGNDSGAIIAGAGASPGSFEGDRSRLGFSCYGSTVDMQGWGHNVVTTGYGTLYSIEGKNLFYTSTFNGTSSASPIVAGACVLLQSLHRAAKGSVLSPADVRNYLILTGSPQQNGTNPASEHIGPRPDVAAARVLALGTWVDFAWTGPEKGTLLAPFNTVSEAVASAPNGGTVFFQPGASNWTGTVQKPLLLEAPHGSVVIGQ
jgi:subtilisin family serine protease